MMALVREVRAVLAIVALCIVAAVVYGIIHDQITARICFEYFTIGHPPVFATQSPTLLGIGWGIIATWWAGFILACPLAFIARYGSRPQVTAAGLVRPIGVLLVVMGLAAFVAGVVGRVLALNGSFVLHGTLAERVPSDRHVDFLTCAAAHSASYLVGFVGGIVVMLRVWWWRTTQV
jgi:hypothetical protein